MGRVALSELSIEEMRYIEQQLEQYDAQFVASEEAAYICLGAKDGDAVIGGVFATMTAYRIMYISIMYVAEEYRRQGIGRSLLVELEKQAKKLGARYIRLDTFNWQGCDFYKALSYEEIGCYQSDEGHFSEHFFLKRLGES